VRKVVDHILAEFRELKTGPIPEDELRRAKDQLKGGLMLSLESSTSRMSNLARQEMYFQRFFSMDETIEQIECVTAEEVCEMASELFHPDKVAVTVLGNLDGLKLSKENLVF
jgi:predicted Zn-dependent peptidase